MVDRWMVDIVSEVTEGSSMEATLEAAEGAGLEVVRSRPPETNETVHFDVY